MTTEIATLDTDPEAPARISHSKELTLRPGEGGELSGLDKRILEVASAHHGVISAEELAREIGHIEPARAAQRLREILQSQNILSVVERKALVIQDFIWLKEKLKSYVEDGDGIVKGKDDVEYWAFGDPRWAKVLIDTLKELSKMLQIESEDLARAKSSISEAQAGIFSRALRIAFRLFLADIVRQHPEIPEEHFRDAMERALPEAFEYLEARADPTIV